MEMVRCSCGCGVMRPRFDRKGREVFYIKGHQNRQQTDAQKQAWIKNFSKKLPGAWNKGKTYIMKSKTTYANGGAWNKAMRRIFPNACMRCGWKEAGCDTHHIIPKSTGGKYSIENGIILCPNCHRLSHEGKISTEELIRIRRTIKPADS